MDGDDEQHAKDVNKFALEETLLLSTSCKLLASIGVMVDFSLGLEL